MRIFVLMLGCMTIMSCVSNRMVKWNNAIDDIKKSAFIQSYEKYTNQIEKRVGDFKEEKDFIDADDWEIIKKSYQTTKGKFDKVLDNMRTDFSNPKMRRYISEDPDHYFKGFQYEMDSAWKHYLNDTQLKMDRVSNSTEGAFGLSEITLLIGLVKELSSFIAARMEKLNQVSAEYLESHLLSELRLKEWESL